jgi:predicted transcriptional regulator
MLGPLPIISENEPFSHVQKILEAFDAVLTQDQGKITGIITRSDLIKNLSLETKY